MMDPIVRREMKRALVRKFFRGPTPEAFLWLAIVSIALGLAKLGTWLVRR